MAPGGGQQGRLRPAAALCAQRLLFLCLLLGAVCAGLFSDWLLTIRLKGDWFFANADGGQDEVAGGGKSKAMRGTPAKTLQKGDKVVAGQDFLTDSEEPVLVHAGDRGVVLQVDSEGDAEIRFEQQGYREWVYHDKYTNLLKMGVPAALPAGSPAESGDAPAVAEQAGGQERPPAPSRVEAAEPPQEASLEHGRAPAPPSPPPPPPPRRRPPAVRPTPPPEPQAVGPAKRARYKPVIASKGRECLEQGQDLGTLQTQEECERMVVETEGCGSTFMFSEERPDWHCRCCTPEGAEGGPTNKVWDVYVVQSKGSGGSRSHDKAGSYTPKLHSRGHECDEQVVNFGYAATPERCDQMAAAKAECGAHFMFSKSHPDWACRCCSRSGADDGPASPNWDVYAIQGQIPENRHAIPAAAALDPTIGLPVDKGDRPAWLLKEDALVIDARKNKEGGGGKLILQAVLMDASRGWGKKKGDRPRWLRAILAANREHARRHGHALVLRAKPTQPQLTPWQIQQCGKKSKEQCTKDNERENYNWEKHLMLAEYLNSPEKFTHVLMLDADAAFIQPDHDTLATIEGILEEKKKSLFLTDEDWLKYGEGRINGGLIFAKNTAFTKALFQDTFDAHVAGPTPLKSWRIGAHNVVCSSNEQICLNDLWRGGRGDHFAEHTMMAGGTKWNHGAEIGGFDDPGVEILHFMGGAKGTAGEVLCDGKRDVTAEGPEGYGCKK